MSLSTPIDTRHFDVDEPAEVPPDILEVVHSITPSHRELATATLQLLATSPRPMSRDKIARLLGMRPTGLTRTLVLLEDNGLVINTRRFGVGLGSAFLEHGPSWSRQLTSTVVRLASPHLELLELLGRSPVFLAFRLRDRVLLVDGAGHLISDGKDGEHPHRNACATSALHAILGSSGDEMGTFVPSMPGIWAVPGGNHSTNLASRVQLSRTAIALSLYSPDDPTSAEYRHLSQAAVNAARTLTTAFGRQYPH